MMTKNTDLCHDLVTQYVQTLRESFRTSENAFGCSISTPFVRPDGDIIELLVEHGSDGRIVLSDGGATFSYLYVSGLALSKRLQDDARKIGRRYGIGLEMNELVAQVSDGALAGEVAHNLVQAILNVAALIEKRRPFLNLNFDEEVEAIIIGQGKNYDADYPVKGDKETHVVKFHLNSGANLVVQPLSQSNVTRAKRLTERWNYYFRDILDSNPTLTCLAILDDRGEREGVWLPTVTVPLAGLARMIRWSQKTEFVDILERTNA